MEGFVCSGGSSKPARKDPRRETRHLLLPDRHLLIFTLIGLSAQKVAVAWGREEAAYTAIFPATPAIAACPVAGRTRSAPITSAVRRARQVRGCGTTGVVPLQGPQPARREDDGEERGHAERDDASARRLKQVIKVGCHSDLARHVDEAECETQLKQASVCQYVRRRSRCVAVYHKAAAHET
jgi:hypothetical protein